MVVQFRDIVKNRFNDIPKDFQSTGLKIYQNLEQFTLKHPIDDDSRIERFGQSKTAPLIAVNAFLYLLNDALDNISALVVGKLYDPPVNLWSLANSHICPIDLRERFKCLDISEIFDFIWEFPLFLH